MRKMRHRASMMVAKRAGISGPFLSNILSGRYRTGWESAKRLAAVTGTKPDIWMDKRINKMRSAVENFQS